MKICDLSQHRIVRFFWESTGIPILCFMDWCERNIGLTVLLLLLTGIGLRLGYRGMVERLERDEIFYITAVEERENLSDATQSGQALSALVYVGFAVEQLGFKAEWGMRCFNLCCSGLWLYIIYILGKTFFPSEKSGLICLTLVVFNPYMIRLSGQVMREPLYLLVFSCGLFCAIQIVRGVGVLMYAALLGPLTILGIWSRYEGAEMLMLVPLAAIFGGMSIARLNVKRREKWCRLGVGILLYLVMLGTAGIALYYFCPEYFQYLWQKVIMVHNYTFFLS